jgi:glycine/D-amino acid oxidase-like deaminating enzyme
MREVYGGDYTPSMENPSQAPVHPALDAGTSWWQDQAPSPGCAAVDGDAHYEVAVIGGGVSGCSTAWHLARAGVRVALLEARDIASGASGRNGGFLLAGLANRFEALVDIVGFDRASQLYALSATGRDRLMDTAASIGVGEHAARTGSLRVAVDLDEVDDLDLEASLLERAGFSVERLTRAELPDDLGAHFLGGLRFPEDGRSFPAAWVRGLARAAIDAGVQVHEHTPVSAIDDDAERVTLTTPGGTITADRVVVATEAWLSGLLPEFAGIVLPYRSQILCTEPPRGTGGDVRRVLSHVTWSRRGWDYAQQTASGHVVIGGEQLEEVERLRSWEEVTEPTDQAWLESWVERVLGFEPIVAARWAGILSQTPDGFPYVGALPGRPRVFSCGGWGGAGNVLGFVGGGMLAEALTTSRTQIPEEFSPQRLRVQAAVGD